MTSNARIRKCKQSESGNSVIQFIPADQIEAVFAPKVRSRQTWTNRPPTARHFTCAAIGLLLFTVYGSLLPFHFTSRPVDGALVSFQKITFYPTDDLGPRGDWVISTVQYGLLSFLGLAALVVDRSRWAGLVGALFVLAACIILATAIEFLQLFFPPRTVSLNDILAESVGGILGVTVWLIAGRRMTKWLRRLSAVFSLNELARRLLPGYVVALFVVQLMPFDFIVGQHELALKWTEGKISLIPFWGISTAESIGKQLLTIASFLPLGIMSAFAFRRQVDRAPDLPWQTFLLPPIIELCQLLVYSRSFDATDLFTGCLGIALGGRMADRIHLAFHSVNHGSSAPPRRPLMPIFWLALFVVWGVTVVYVYWRPFNFTSNPTAFAGDPEEMSLYGLRRMSYAPFVDYYWGSKYSALDNFVRKALAFFPFGVLMAYRERELFQPLATPRLIAIAAALAIVLQVGRYFLPGHTPSSTDVLIFVTGAWLGYRFTHLLRAVAWAESNSLPI